MPRQLLRDGRVVADDWTYLDDAGTVASAEGGVILSLARWVAERSAWLEAPGRLGVVLSAAHKVEQLAPDLTRFDLIVAEFPGPSDGRGYTQGRLLRERYRYAGELRAAGYVRRDQIFFLARCGFNSFELPESELAAATGAFHTFSAAYQPANDAGLPSPLWGSRTARNPAPL
jgi:uncharacterized protein (DUF934 family)